jgi:hypothetical protein
MEPKQLAEPNQTKSSTARKPNLPFFIIHLLCLSRRYGGWIYFLEKAPATKTKLHRQPDVVRSEFGVRGLF